MSFGFGWLKPSFGYTRKLRRPMDFFEEGDTKWEKRNQSRKEEGLYVSCYLLISSYLRIMTFLYPLLLLKNLNCACAEGNYISLENEWLQRQNLAMSKNFGLGTCHYRSYRLSIDTYGVFCILRWWWWWRLSSCSIFGARSLINTRRWQRRGLDCAPRIGYNLTSLVLKSTTSFILQFNPMSHIFNPSRPSFELCCKAWTYAIRGPEFSLFEKCIPLPRIFGSSSRLQMLKS